MTDRPTEPRSDTGARDRDALLWQGLGQSGDRPAGRRRKKGADDGSRETPMVPRATFQSYYGRPVLKAPVWKDDIAYYFFLGGLSAGSSLLGAGADLTSRPGLRRGTRVAALASLGVGAFYLVKDLGRPERFLNMLRVVKPTSPMSVGTWVLTAYGPAVGLAAASELLPQQLRRSVLGRLIDSLARPAGLSAAALAPAVASYTAVLLSQTAVPAWHDSHEELPFIFTGSAAASAGGLGMIIAPAAEAGPARALALYGAAVELAASRRLEHRLGVESEHFHTGRAGRELRLAATLTAVGAAGTLVLGRRGRVAGCVAGAALVAGGFFERLGLLHAGAASAVDPRATVQPQRARIEAGRPARS
ncbi:MAG: hypothetical protein QOI54_1996 [Actinomycetota bacterium]|nr:hypothetical protein [Actinomycetota bacterium]